MKFIANLFANAETSREPIVSKHATTTKKNKHRP